MSKRVVTLYNKEYNVNCDPGQEERLDQIVRFVESRMKKVEKGVGNTTEARLLMLTCMHLADELIDQRQKFEQSTLENEELFVAAVEHLGNRVAHIASQVGSA
jgi:cell division protein ZapA